MPAFAMAQSSRPNVSTHCATASRLLSMDRTSPRIAAIRAPWSRRSASRPSSDRSRIATRAPSATKRSTIACPRPDPPPVTSATCPSSRPMFASFNYLPIRIVREGDEDGHPQRKAVGGLRERARRSDHLLRSRDLQDGDGADLRARLELRLPRIADPPRRRLLLDLYRRRSDPRGSRQARRRFRPAQYLPTPGE